MRFGIPATRNRNPTVVRRWHIVLIACGALAVFAVGYSSQHNKVEVAVTFPTYQEIESTVAANGTVIPANDFQARANFPGIVDEIYVHLGEKVHAGQLLVTMGDQYAASRVAAAKATLDAAEVSRENVEKSGSQEDRIMFSADLTRAQGEQKNAASSLETIRQLQARGSASEAEVLAAEQRLKDADAALQAVKRRTTDRYSPTDIKSWDARVSADKASLSAEQVSYNNANIKTPISGTVYLIPVLRYDFVPMGAELLHVADLSKIYVRANFLEQDVGELKSGQPVTITWDGSPGHVWHGHIVIHPLALTHVGDMNVGQCTIAVDDARDDLPVNTNVTVVVTVAKHARALTIPRQALRRDDSSTQFVYRLKDGRLMKTQVHVGVVNAFRAEITSGVQAGDAIALYAVDHQPLSDHLQAKAAE
jgi:HlyD family secretion protein